MEAPPEDTKHSLGAGLGFFCYCPVLGRADHPQRAASGASCPEATLLPSLAPGSSIPAVCGQAGGLREAVTPQGTGCSLSFRIDTVPSVQSSPLDLGWPWGDQKLWDLSELSLPLYLDRVQETEAEGPPWLQEEDGNP